MSKKLDVKKRFTLLSLQDSHQRCLARFTDLGRARIVSLRWWSHLQRWAKWRPSTFGLYLYLHPGGGGGGGSMGCRVHPGHTDSHTLDTYIWGGGGSDIRSMSSIRPNASVDAHLCSPGGHESLLWEGQGGEVSSILGGRHGSLYILTQKISRLNRRYVSFFSVVSFRNQ